MTTAAPLLIASLSAGLLLASVAAAHYYRQARAANRTAAAARERAADADRRLQGADGRVEAMLAAARQIQGARDPADNTRHLHTAIEHLRSALVHMEDAALRYKALAETLEDRLTNARGDVADWEAAVNYHVETIRRLSIDNERLAGQVDTLQMMYAQRTQEALHAGLTRWITQDAGIRGI